MDKSPVYRKLGNVSFEGVIGPNELFLWESLSGVPTPNRLIQVVPTSASF